MKEFLFFPPTSQLFFFSLNSSLSPWEKMKKKPNKMTKWDQKSIRQLRKIARKMGLKNKSNLTKHDLILFIEERSKKNFAFNDECPICLLDGADFHVMEPCKHQIHLDCAKDLLSLNCPICRKEVENFPFHISVPPKQVSIIDLRDSMIKPPRYVFQFYYDFLYFLEKRRYLRKQKQIRNQRRFETFRGVF